VKPKKAAMNALGTEMQIFSGIKKFYPFFPWPLTASIFIISSAQFLRRPHGSIINAKKQHHHHHYATVIATTSAKPQGKQHVHIPTPNLLLINPEAKRPSQ
jgi:hypothetical protein